jgi:hypothetical protein
VEGRASQGDTKTPEAQRTLALPRRCVEAWREHRVRQAEDRLAAAPLWQDHGLVFASAVGTPAKSRLALPTQDFMPIARRIGSTWLCTPSLA